VAGAHLSMGGNPWIFLAILVNDDVNSHNPIDVFWAISTRTNPEADILTAQFPPDKKTDNRGKPPIPIKRPLKGQRYRTGINAAITRKTFKKFERSRLKNYDSLDLAKYLVRP
jgi:3-polyprenyl-4-hydroxybenzoate decarboxylase